MASLSAPFSLTIFRTRCTFWLAAGCAVLSCFSLGAAPPQLLTGTPRVPEVPSADREVIRIVADVDADEEVRVYTDRLEWTHHSGEGPASVKVNDVSWKVQLKNQLMREHSPVVIPEDFRQLGAAIDVVYGRGYINFYGQTDHLQVRLTDPEAGGAPADIVLRPGEQLAAYEPDPRNIARVEELAEEMPRPHPRGAESKTRRDLKNIQNQWRRKCLAGAYEEFGNRDPRWDAQVIRFLEAVASDQVVSQEQLIREGDKVLALGCDDPLVCGALGEGLWKNRDPRRAEPLILHAVLGFEKSQYPSRTTRRFPAILARLLRRQSAENWRLGEKLYARSIAETVRTLSEKLEGDERRALLAELQSEFKSGAYDLFRGQRPQLIRAISEAPEADPWLSHMLQADYLYDQGWQARGTGLGSTVTETGWQELRSHLEQARGHVLDAWGLFPDYPEAATSMISLVQVIGGVGEDSQRFWFDRAVAAQMDVFGAHSSYMNGLLPQWGGSHRALIEFGVECLRTKRFDTVVPLYIHNAIGSVAAGGGDALPLLEEAGVLEELIPAMETFVREPTEWASLSRVQTENVLTAWTLGMTDEARKYLQAVGTNLDQGSLRSRNIDGEVLRYDLLTPTSSAKSAPARLPLGTLMETPAPAHTMDISKAGDMIAVSSQNREHPLTLFDLKTGKSESLSAEGQPLSVVLKFSDDGKYLACHQAGSVQGKDGSSRQLSGVTVWDLTNRTSREVVSLAEQHVYGLAWLPDNRHIVSSLWPEVFIRNVETGKVVAKTDAEANAFCVEVSPDGKILAVGRHDGTIRLYAVPDMVELEKGADGGLRMPAIGDLQKHLRAVHMMCFSPDGKWLASSSRDDRSVWLWDFASRKAVYRLEGFGTAFSPDSRRLATCEGARLVRQAAVWDVESGKALYRLVNSESTSMRKLVFTADGEFVVATGLDKALRTWEARMDETGPTRAR